MKLGIWPRRSKYLFPITEVVCLVSYAALLSTPARAQSYLYNQSTFATGNLPAAVVTADFNGDGRLDLAVVNQTDNTVSILLGKPDGTFQPQVTYPTGTSPNAIVSADFNGDGKLDLAITNSQANTVSVLLGNGDGTFQPKVDAAVGNSPDALVAADFNGDKNIDLAVANATDGTVSVFLGNGNGTFQSQSTVTVGQSPESIASADFNGDGKMDVAVANESASNISTYLSSSSGNGTFQPPMDTTYSLTFDGFAAGYFQGTANHLDMAVTTTNPANNATFLNIFLGNGSGSFTVGQQYAIGSNNMPLIVSSDFNGDGNADLAVTDGPQVMGYISNGDGTFQTAVAYAVSSFANSIVLGDFNGDGITDLAAGGPNGFAVFLGNGNGTFQVAINTSFNPGITLTEAADFNGDGKMDLEGYNSTGNFIFTGNGDGTFNGPLQLDLPAIDVAAGAADFNSDGVSDLVFPDGGSGSFPPFANVFLSAPTASIFPSPANFGQVDVGTQSQPQPLVVTNIGNVALSVPSIAMTGDFSQVNTCSAALANEAACQISVTFTPTATGTRNGTVTITDNSITGPQEVSLTGTGLAPVAGLAPISLSFGNQLAGSSSAAQNVTLSNTGTAALQIESVTISANFTIQTNHCGSSLAAGGNCTLDVSFSPPQLGPLAGTLTVTDNNNGTNGSNQTVSLSGTGIQPAVSLSAGGHGFGDQSLNTTSAAQPITLTNNGTAPLTLSSITVTGNFAVAAGTTCLASTPVNVGANCLIMVTFTPTAAGNLNGTLTITDNAPSSPQAVTLSGTGTAPAVSLSPSSLSFAGQLNGTQSAAQTVKLTNTGNQALTIKSIGITGDYKQVNSCGLGLAINANCAITVIFAPTAGGARSGVLTITDNAGAGVQTVALTGQGEDFTLSAGASPTSASVAPGGTAAYTLTFSPLGGLNQLVQLGCTGAPLASTCTVSPNSLTPGGATPTTVTVKVVTSVGVRVAPGMRPKRLPPLGKIVLTLFGILAFTAFVIRLAPPPAGSQMRHRLPQAFAVLALLGLMVLSMAACGGSGSSGPTTPAGTYTLTVTGTTNPGTANLNHSVMLTLTVQ